MKRSSLRNTFFNHPKKTAAGVCVVTTAGFIITLCAVLIPLGETRATTNEDMEAALRDFDAAKSVLAGILASIQEAKQRVVDLDCVMPKEEQYKLDVQAAFDRVTQSNATATERLKLFWKLEFKPDVNEKKQTIEAKSWDDSWSDGEQTYYTTYYYDEITTIDLFYKNIIQTIPGMTDLQPLNCGYYARSLQLTPVVYQTGGTQPVTSGYKTREKVFIDYSQEFGSRVQMSQFIDGQVKLTDAIISRSASQADAVNTLAMNIYQFFGGFLMAVLATSTNYLELQKKIEDSIPMIEGTVPAANGVVMKTQQIFTDRQADFNAADETFHTALAIWLPMLIVPFFLSLATCLFLTCCKARCAVDEEQNGRELRSYRS